METQNNHTFKWILISALICAAVAVLSFFVPVLAILVPLIITIVWVKKGFLPAIIPYLLFVFASYYLMGEVFAVLFAMITFPAAVASPLLLKQKKRMLRQRTDYFVCIGHRLPFIYRLYVVSNRQKYRRLYRRAV